MLDFVCKGNISSQSFFFLEPWFLFLEESPPLWA